MSIFLTTIFLTVLTVMFMFAAIAGGIYLYAMIALLSALTWYYFITRTRQRIQTIQSWQGEVTGVITTSHPGGLMAESRTYREAYIEYQFQYQGTTYTSTCVEMIRDPGGTRAVNIHPAVTEVLKTLVYIASDRGQYFTLSRDRFDPDDQVDCAARKIHNQSKVGDNVTVYFNTHNPSESVLVRRTQVPFDFKVTTALLIFLYLMMAILPIF